MDDDIPQLNEEQDNTAIIDKIIQNNPLKKINPGQYENVQTQSAVISSREEAEARLAQINAANAAYQHQQEVAQKKAAAKKTAIYIIIIIIFVAIIAAGVWLAIVALNSTTTGVGENGTDKKTEEDKTTQIEGYKCKKTGCSIAATVSERLFIIKDDTHYYLYNKEDGTSSGTTIPEQDYHEIKPFTWGSATLAILDPESGQSGLYSVTGNRILTEFSYDSFYTNPDDDVYKDMKSIVGSQIIARANGAVRLIDLNSGKEIIRANKRILTNGGFYFGYEEGGVIHVYTSDSRQILVTKSSSERLFVKNSVLYYYTQSLTAYDANGNRLNNDSELKRINRVPSKERLAQFDKSFFAVPTE